MNCKHCGHLKKDHCKSGVMHAHWRDAARQMPDPRLHRCLTMHCLKPMCSCVQWEPNADPVLKIAHFIRRGLIYISPLETK
jgi:hypothetical protein